VVVVGKYLMNMIRFGLLALALAFGLSSCAPEGAPIQEAQYAATIVGDWIGTVGDTKETISFGADGKFVSDVRPGGFINNTLSQGIAGTIHGTWSIKSKVITLTISSAEDVTLLNRATTGTIESFTRNELVITSSSGETSTFVRT
jgi:hypothetical protein